MSDRPTTAIHPVLRLAERFRLPLAVVCCALAAPGFSPAQDQPGAENAAPSCSFQQARADESGQRRLALLVGVGKYANPEVTTLDGPMSDVRSMYELLTGPNGYGFPKENVCVLADEKATSKAFLEAWQKALVDRAQQGDIAVFFFAGHGSQARDWNGDEPDGYDETLMLHDARFQGQRDLIDDQLNGLVARLYQKTSNVTMILDSCNSGSASRGGSRAKARFFDRLDDQPAAGEVAAGGDGGEGWEPESMPGLVVMSAARDGSSAMEIDGAGVFTQTLLEVLGEAAEPLTYAQVSHRAPRRIAAQSQQVAYFQGALDRVVFGATERKRPASWVVRALEGDRVRLQGVPMPGWSKGALLRVHSGSATMEEVKDASTARGYLELAEIGGFEARATYVVDEGAEWPVLEEGDLAVLVQAGEGATTISVRLRPEGEEGGLTQVDIAALKAAWEKDEEASEAIEWSDGGGFEVAKTSGRYQILGPEGRVRNTMDRAARAASVIQNLADHADQKAFLELRADPGSVFENDRTLAVRIVPQGKQSPCGEGNVWLQAELGEEQLIPMCHRWAVEVTLDEASPKSLLVGGVMLWNDGSKDGFPSGGEKILLEPGGTGRVFLAESVPPLGVPEHLLVFGTQEDNPIDWGAIHSEAKSRGPGGKNKPKKSALGSLVGKYFKGKRGGRKSPPMGGALQPWTSTHVVIRAEANVFARPDTRELSGGPVELAAAFVLPTPDLRPYAPADKAAALYRVLEQAVVLTDPEAAEPSVAAPIFDAFAKAGLALPAEVPAMADLAAGEGPMAAAFAACELVDLRPGDLIVQRDAAAGAGHLSMVLDPREHVVWGALGFEGAPAPIPGVAFHHQRFPRDWKLWDLDEMRQVACWRHQELASDWADRDRRPGSRRLDPNTVCGIDAAGTGCPTNRMFR